MQSNSYESEFSPVVGGGGGGGGGGGVQVTGL